MILGILFNISGGSFRVSNCSFSAFALSKVTRRTSLPQIYMLRIKIPSWSSILASTTSKDFEPRKAIATSQELVVP